ncbi:MAG: hypothetical protein QXO57_02545 [Candidatus Aenigmatarchaeota archaeon]
MKWQKAFMIVSAVILGIAQLMPVGLAQTRAFDPFGAQQEIGGIVGAVNLLVAVLPVILLLAMLGKLIESFSKVGGSL